MKRKKNWTRRSPKPSTFIIEACAWNKRAACGGKYAERWDNFFLWRQFSAFTHHTCLIWIVAYISIVCISSTRLIPSTIFSYGNFVSTFVRRGWCQPAHIREHYLRFPQFSWRTIEFYFSQGTKLEAGCLLHTYQKPTLNYCHTKKNR